MKIVGSYAVGGLRQLTHANIITKDLNVSYGSPIVKNVDQLIADSAGAIKVTQTALKQALDYYENYGLNALHTFIDTMDYKSAKKIFPDLRKKVFGRKTPLKKHAFFKAPYDPSVLPEIINKEFNTPKMGDFATRVAFAVFGQRPDGKQRTRLVTSYDNPEAPVASLVSASCAFPVYLPGETVKSEWLGDEPGEERILFDGGIKCPHPINLGIEEARKILHKDEKLVAFSILMHDEKTFDLKKLKKGGYYPWVRPDRKSALIRASFDANVEMAEAEAKAKAVWSNGQLEYFSFYDEITDDDRIKYKTNFDSDDSSDHNLEKFKERSFASLKTDRYKENKEGLLTALQKREAEKENPEYNQTMALLTDNGKLFIKEDEEIPVVKLPVNDDIQDKPNYA